MTDPELITPPDAPSPADTYPPDIVSGGFFFIAGQGPFNPTGDLVDEAFAQQLRQTFQTLEAIARAAETSLTKAVRLGVHLKDLAESPGLNELSQEFPTEPYPARTSTQADLNGSLIEADPTVAIP